MKLGKLPARKDSVTFKLVNYAVALPTPPTSLKLFTAVTDWQGMLGNDQYGDCVWAGGDHEHIFVNGINNTPISFRPHDALADYAAVTGFKPGDPNSDQGTDVQVAASYRRKTGLIDATGTRHRVAAYLALTPKNTAQLKTALYLFGAVGIGFEFPDYAMAEFNANQSWHIKTGGSIQGGHYVPAVGYDARYIYVVTWGKVQKMSWGFYKKYNDETVTYLNPELLKADTTPEGFNLAQLQTDLNQL